MTKRNLLSAIARLFDPLGLLSSILLTAKALFQQLCVDNVCWDDDFQKLCCHDSKHGSNS